MHKGFGFLQWEIHCMLSHTVKNQSTKKSINRSIIYPLYNTYHGFLVLPWTWPVAVSFSFKGNWDIFHHWLQSFTSSTFRLKIQNKRIMKNSAILKSMWRSFFDKQVEFRYLHMYAYFVLYIKRVTLILWETIKRLPVLWLIKMWETINTGHHLPVCALISHQTQRSRSQSPYVGRGEPD